MRQGTTETTTRRRTLRRNPEQAVKDTEDNMWTNAPWFGPYTMEEINARIAKAEVEMEAGLGTPHEEFMEEMEESLSATDGMDKELESCKLATIQAIANAESLEDIYWVTAETQARLMQKWNEEAEKDPQPRYTMEELNARIDRAEAEFEAGEYYTCEEVHRMLEEEFPWLK